MAVTHVVNADCVFCRELSGSRDTNFAKRYPEISSRIVGETASLVAFPCIGQLSVGHFLVVPKAHYKTFRETAERVPDLGEQLRTLLRHVHSLLDVTEGDSLFFEHGADCASDGGCGIYHAHLHVVPGAGAVDLGKHFPRLNQPVSTAISDLWDQLPRSGPYALFGSTSHNFVGHRLDAPLPSQTIRKIVAAELGCAIWDWREADRENGLLNAFQPVSSR